MNLIICLFLALGIYRIVEILYKKYWDKNLVITMNFSRNEAFVGDELFLVETVENRKFLPLPLLLLKFCTSTNLAFKDVTNSTITDNYYRNDLISVMMYQKIRQELKFICTHRGVYNIDEVVLVTYNLFFEDKEVLQFPLGINLVVYPKIIDTSEFSMILKSLLGDVVAKRSLIEDPFEFNGVRDYRITDSMKMVNWKASARSLDLKVNTRNYCVSQRVKIIVNLNNEDYCRNTQFEETAISLAASFANGFIREGIQTSCYVNARDKVTKDVLMMPANNSEQHLKVIWYSLARLDLEEQPLVDFYQMGLPLIREADRNEWIIFISLSRNIMLQKMIIENINPESSITWIEPCYRDSYRDGSGDIFKGIIPWFI